MMSRGALSLSFLAGLALLAAGCSAEPVEAQPPTPTIAPTRTVEPPTRTPLPTPTRVVVVPPTPSPTPAEQTYTVQSGDTLWKIAEKYYGDGGQYPRIKDANKDVLKGGDLISVGMQLKIPK